MIRRTAIWLKRGVGLGLVLGLLFFVDVDAVLDRLKDVQPGWLGVAALALVAATLLGAFSLHLLLDSPQRPPLLRFIPMFWLAWAIGLVVPGQIGDMATIATGLRRRGYEWHMAIGRNLVDKGVSLAVIVICALSGLFLWLDRGEALRILAVVLVLGTLTGIGLGRLVGLAQGRNYGPLQRLAGFLGDVVAAVGYAARHYPQRILINLVLTVIKFGLIASAYGAALRSLGGGAIAMGDLVTIVAASSLAAYIPLSPNGLGTAEAVGIALFGHIGVPQAAVLAAYLILRALVMGLAWVPVGLWFLSTTLRRA